jgi:hypothetical protein
VNIVVNEFAQGTAVGGVADRASYKARRLFKAMRWDRERNSQRWGIYTFMEAEPVHDRRYFGTDDALDPEVAPPVNDIEPARRIYHIIGDEEYADKVASVTVDARQRGYAAPGATITLEGGVPVFGSKVGPGNVGDRANFGLLAAGKAVAKVEKLFVPETGKPGFAVTYKAGSGVFVPSGSYRTPLLEGALYTFGLRGVKTDALPTPGGQEYVTIHSRCLRDPASKQLVLSTRESLTGDQLSMLKAWGMTRGAGRDDTVTVENAANGCYHRRITGVTAIYDAAGRYYQPGKDWVAQDANGVALTADKLPASLFRTPGAGERGSTVFKIAWLGARQPEAAKPYTVVLAYQSALPSGDLSAPMLRWEAGPVESVTIAEYGEQPLVGSYKYTPGDAAVRQLRSRGTVQAWNPYAADGPHVTINGDSPAAEGFTVGMAVAGEKSGAKGIIRAFGHDGTRPYLVLESWNLASFQNGEALQPAYTGPGCLGAYAMSRPGGEMAVAPSSSARPQAQLALQAVFASENPVLGTKQFTLQRGEQTSDVLRLQAQGGNGLDYYPWRVTTVSDAQGTVYQAYRDFLPVVDTRSQQITLQWGGAWPEQSLTPRKPVGDYQVSVQYLAGSPTHANLPWPEWRAINRTDGRFTVSDDKFISGKGGRIVLKGADGLVTGRPYVEGTDYTVSYAAETGVASIAWKANVTPPTGNLYLQYRKLVDDYEHLAWGSPKHLSGTLNHAVLVDAYERFMGNFGWIDYTVNYPGYPPALALNTMNTTFKDLLVSASGATQASAGGIYLWTNYDGNHDNIVIRDTNYGFIMPINLYHPWQNYGVRADGATYNKAPAAESDVAYGNSGWGGAGGPDFLPNRYQSLLPYTGGNEQSYFKNFQFRCGDIGLFIVDSGFYELTNIWASGAWSVDRPRGSVMVFGTPANGIEQFSGTWQFGRLGSMFGEQAINGDYALPVVRCCAVGSGQEVDFSGVTQGRQVLWGKRVTGKAASPRSTVMLGGGWLYSMGVWSPTRLYVTVNVGTKTFALREAFGTGADGRTRVPLRHGATYYLKIPGASGTGGVLTTNFIYDSAKPLTAQELHDAPAASLSALADVTNGNIRKSDFNAIELDKIRTHYGWSLLLTGTQNEVRVSEPALQDRARRILEPNGGNLISDGPQQYTFGHGVVAAPTKLLTAARVTVSDGIVTVTQAEHGLYNGESIIISNACDAQQAPLAALNGVVTVKVLDQNTFTFSKPGLMTGVGTCDIASRRVSIPHRLNAVPTVVTVTPTSNTAFWVMDKTATQFVVNCPGNAELPAQFDWVAFYVTEPLDR